MSYPGLDEEVIALPLAGGAFRLIFDHDPPSVRCHLEWSGERLVIEGAIPTGIAPNELFMRVANLDIDAAYFVGLSTP